MRFLRRRGWEVVSIRGDHHKLRHPDRDGIVVVSGRPGRMIPAGTVGSILRQAGIDPKELQR
jgi:predicted RNA binding protein YcfA (HicA-like mRNA interferase family)